MHIIINTYSTKGLNSRPVSNQCKNWGSRARTKELQHSLMTSEKVPRFQCCSRSPADTPTGKISGDCSNMQWALTFIAMCWLTSWWVGWLLYLVSVPWLRIKPRGLHTVTQDLSQVTLPQIKRLHTSDIVCPFRWPYKRLLQQACYVYYLTIHLLLPLWQYHCSNNATLLFIENHLNRPIKTYYNLCCCFCHCCCYYSPLNPSHKGLTTYIPLNK